MVFVIIRQTMDSQKLFSDDLTKIITHAIKNKIYGSIEVYFEEGNVTQITQRIINKIKSHKKKEEAKK